jgi:hypothetical protein
MRSRPKFADQGRLPSPRPSLKRRGRRPNRAGYALVLFVMMFFGLMGLAALVIDMGFARLAQRQMQTAVDSAALEGLRNDPTTVYGRQQASQIVAGMFTDYSDSSGAVVHYGAGPVVNFSDGVGPTEVAASQLIEPGNPPVYQPGGLELNTDNAQEGDMVAGTYGSNAAYGQQFPSPLADEDANYNRRDFTPNASSTSALLVRMRRTDNSDHNENDAGVASSGPTVPLLFGRGSTMARSGDSGQLSVASGITVRATAIAAAGDGIQFAGGTPYSAGRARSVGPPYQGTDANNNPIGVPGITPFAVTQQYWESGTWGQSPTANGVDLTTANGTVGTIIEPAVVVVGDQIVAASDDLPFTQPTVDSSLYRYVPIYNTAGTVIGFGNVQWQNGVLSKNASGNSPVGSGNASNVLVRLPQDAAGNSSNADLSQVFAWNAQLGDPLHLVFVPVLVNHYIGQSNP